MDLINFLASRSWEQKNEEEGFAWVEGQEMRMDKSGENSSIFTRENQKDLFASLLAEI